MLLRVNFHAMCSLLNFWKMFNLNRVFEEKLLCGNKMLFYISHVRILTVIFHSVQSFKVLSTIKWKGLCILTMLAVQIAIFTIFTFFNCVECNLIQVVINRMYCVETKVQSHKLKYPCYSSRIYYVVWELRISGNRENLLKGSMYPI